MAEHDLLTSTENWPRSRGAHFGIGRYIRVGFGHDLKKLKSGLKKMDVTLGLLRTPRAK